MDINENVMKTVKRVVVLGCGKPYDFIPEGETERRIGCKMFYLPSDDLHTKIFDDESGICGLMPQGKTMDPSFYEEACKVGLPCYADFTFTVVLGASGTKVKVTDIKLVAENKLDVEKKTAVK